MDTHLKLNLSQYSATVSLLKVGVSGIVIKKNNPTHPLSDDVTFAKRWKLAWKWSPSVGTNEFWRPHPTIHNLPPCIYNPDGRSSMCCQMWDAYPCIHSICVDAGPLRSAAGRCNHQAQLQQRSSVRPTHLCSIELFVASLSLEDNKRSTIGRRRSGGQCACLKIRIYL